MGGKSAPKFDVIFKKVNFLFFPCQYIIFVYDEGKILSLGQVLLSSKLHTLFSEISRIFAQRFYCICAKLREN